MEGTFLQRVSRLITHLARQPQFVPAYLVHLPIWKRTPLDIELPWFSYGAIRYLEDALRPNHRVFEYGSGGSTLFFGPANPPRDKRRK